MVYFTDVFNVAIQYFICYCRRCICFSLCGTNALAAINIAYPIVSILTGIALMFAAGGSAIAALSIGCGRIKQAQKEFSVCVIISMITGILISAVIFLFLPQILVFLGATDLTVKDCKIYAAIWLIGVPAVIGKELFTYFIRVDGSPTYSFFIAVAGGIVNIILDYIFIGCMNMGVLGAGLATILGLIISFALGIIYFIKRKKHLHFTFTDVSLKSGLRCATNGFSQFIDQAAIAITTVVFNRTALSLAGENGIAAVTIIMYLQYIFIGIYFGYSMGISPLLSYAYGDEKKPICKKLEGYCYRFFAISLLFIYVIIYISAPLVVSFFAKSGTEVYAMAVSGMRIYGLGFLFSGFNIFTAIRLTSYGKGQLSAIVTFLRSFVLLLIFLITLPILWKMNGLWLAMPLAEAVTIFVSLVIAFSTRIR